MPTGMSLSSIISATTRAAAGMGVLVAALTAGACHADAGQATKTRPLLTTAQFALYSDFATKLNRTLIADFVAGRDERPGAFDAEKDKTCFDGLPSTAREGWGRAVEYYRTNQA